MGRIKNTDRYPIKTNPIAEDYIIGSDSENNGTTVNFSVGDLTGGIINPINQDNMFKFVSLGVIDVPNNTVATPFIVDTINNLDPSVEITDQQIPYFNMTLRDDDGNLRNAVYSLQNKGKGTYGVGGTNVVIPLDLLRLFIQPEVSSDDVNRVNAVVLNLGEIGTTSPVDIINALDPSIEIVGGTNVYFDSTNSGRRILYGYRGDNGVFGLLDDQVTSLSLFVISEELDDSDDQTASEVNINAITGITATNVQGALEEINANVNGITDSDDQTASEVSINTIAGLTATDVQGALEELNTTVTGIDESDDQTALEVSVDSSGFDGNLDATDTDLQKVAQKLDDLTLGTVVTTTNGLTNEGADGTSTYVESDEITSETILLDTSMDTFSSPVVSGNVIVKQYTIPANTLEEDTVLMIKIKMNRLLGTGNPFMNIVSSSADGVINSQILVGGVNGLAVERHVVVKDTQAFLFTDSGAFFNDLNNPTVNRNYVPISIDRTQDMILDFAMNFTEVGAQYQLQFLSIQQLKQ